MTQTLVEMAKDLTRSLVETGRLSPEDMQDTLQQTYATLSALKIQEESGTSAPVPASRTGSSGLAKEHQPDMQLPAWNVDSPSSSCPVAIS